MRRKSFLSRVIVTVALGGGLLLASAAAPALADRDWYDCHKRLEAERAKLDRDVPVTASAAVKWNATVIG